MMKMHQRTLCTSGPGRCILRVSMTRRYFIEKSQNVAAGPTPSPLLSHKSTAFKSVTGKIRSDVPHLSRRRSISVGVRLRYFENFPRSASCDLLLALKMIEMCFKHVIYCRESVGIEQARELEFFLRKRRGWRMSNRCRMQNTSFTVLFDNSVLYTKRKTVKNCLQTIRGSVGVYRTRMFKTVFRV